MLTFLYNVADKYKEDRRAREFIPDLLQLDVPQLFATSSDDEMGDTTSVGQSFSNFLKAYIQRNGLRKDIFNQMQTMIAHITDEKQHLHFHWIILNVLQSVRTLYILFDVIVNIYR